MEHSGSLFNLKIIFVICFYLQNNNFPYCVSKKSSKSFFWKMSAGRDFCSIFSNKDCHHPRAVISKSTLFCAICRQKEKFEFQALQTFSVCLCFFLFNSPLLCLYVSVSLPVSLSVNSNGLEHFKLLRRLMKLFVCRNLCDS